MNIAYTTRGFELTGQIKKHTEDKLKKILALDQFIEISLTLVQARHRFKAELIVHNRSARFTAIQETPDVFVSINAVIDKIQKQIKRHKEKLVNRKREARPKTSKLGANMGETPDSPRIMRARRKDIKLMSQDEALTQMETGREPFLLFRNVDSNRISVLFRRKDGNFGLVDSES